MFALVFAGEAIFGLPFVLVRIFRPTVLEVLELNNTQLGTAFSAYGIVAMAAYLLGGPLADRFSARRLMVTALLTTSLGGAVFWTLPDATTLAWLYAWFGLTTILPFWAALLRVTREWGGDDAQGRAYGLLDGGRGLVYMNLPRQRFLYRLHNCIQEFTMSTLLYRLHNCIQEFTMATLLLGLHNCIQEFTIATLLLGLHNCIQEFTIATLLLGLHNCIHEFTIATIIYRLHNCMH